MKTNHTPEPWFYDNDGFVYGGPDKLIVADPHSSPEIDEAEMEANGQLIAAAPGLLAALKASSCPHWVHNAAITDDIEALRAIALWYADWNNTIRAAAIAKAEA